jgi:hypothetical protein
MAWINVVEPEEATGVLKQEYDAASERAGKRWLHAPSAPKERPIARATL